MLKRSHSDIEFQIIYNGIALAGSASRRISRDFRITETSNRKIDLLSQQICYTSLSFYKKLSLGLAHLIVDLTCCPKHLS